MKYYSIKEETITGIADAIRAKQGGEQRYSPAEMAVAIRQMEDGAKLNIAYGQTAPEDTSKLWVRTQPAEGVQITSQPVAAGEKIENWINLLPVGLSHMDAVAVGTNIYLFGGRSEGYTTNGIYLYDTEANTISRLEEEIQGYGDTVAAAAVGNRVYMFGGWNSNLYDYIVMFDTETNSRQLTDAKLPIAACRIAAVTMGEKIFLFGGRSEDAYGDWIWVYDSKAQRIYDSGKKLPVAVQSIAAAAIGTNIYLFGGYDGEKRHNDIYVFDTVSYMLSKKNATIPSTAGANNISAAAIGTKIYLFGGRTTGNVITDAIAVYDAEEDAVEILDSKLPTAAESMAATAIGESIYLFGGFLSDTSMPPIHRFVATLPLAEKQLLIETSQTENFVTLGNAGNTRFDIGISNVYMGNEDGVAEKVSAALYKDAAWVEI